MMIDKLLRSLKSIWGFEVSFRAGYPGVSEEKPAEHELTISIDGEPMPGQRPEDLYPKGQGGAHVIGIEPDPRAALSPERIAAQRFAERRRYRW